MSDYLLRPEDLPTWGQRTALRVLNLFGWRLRFKPLPGPHGIAVVYPHTSNWDFLVGLFGKWAIGLPFRWLAKDSLFRGPMGAVMRYWGGVPVDRSAPQGATQKLAQTMLSSKWCWVAITPEGTRSYRPHWKSGFYRLALAAKVPVLLVYMDYRAKELSVVDYMTLSGDEEADMAAIARVYEGHEALYPANAAPVRLAPREKNGTREQA
ncbi:1-acyl-sn-glycerol-3-phosphate acyltransferase [Massilia solisilvae]|uniref:1-acyl-sn-glycerol-3-phosphate acyltransferase n=1 Tax=Massilia solisilvae TaxID=1811225 RepID=A0ABT2BM45_9BURK|nr:1-acyl-sn-glycerol-3-phosphate acyltransferase [Massilia solisilvae]MCS0609574.1 1-acyl-sn-glycerol-3-phosphate acyltransferase [Massilia solisilvae]